ncbi:relaxase/mobilization nuclease domain-containing protein [Chitinophaga varians]|uniref:Relaxase/mobilization nuclease domain-containing protein n=1 Tax=Chitinophaga varians TaxID=2202339 RepID=A0A847RLJ4_9BACT|nr:relaxase/mobilization nuclease domain-containing protein [Chitinophaga varians]NLR67879.1 relaxase/mobilization nuclease domain-containing protein [Chitinophaga varians]
MVARIMIGENISGAIVYNERKVAESQAYGLLAQSYPEDFCNLNFSQKLNRLQRLADLRPRTKKNCIHIALSFHKDDVLDDDLLRRIAIEYMVGIGFGEQPFLLYRHTDTYNPHVHIVTTCIDMHGDRIYLHDIAKLKSEPTRERIEKDFGLVRARGRNAELSYELDVSNGRVPTKADISKKVRDIVENYSFSSFSEFSAALRLKNIVADRGKEGDLLFKRRGIYYKAVDGMGKELGKPIKASSIYNKPTLSRIEELFAKGEKIKEKFRNRTANIIREVLKSGLDMNGFINELRKRKIDTVIARSLDGKPHGVTFVSHDVACIYKGSDLGRDLSIGSITKHLLSKQHSSEATYNKRFINDLFETTDFSKGFKTVYKDWIRDGFLVHSYKDESDSIFYKLGHGSTQVGNFQNVGSKMSEYFRANQLTPEKTTYVQEQLKEQFGEYLFFGGVQITDAVLNGIGAIVTNAMAIEDEFTGTSISSELLKEARKKSRKKRK